MNICEVALTCLIIVHLTEEYLLPDGCLPEHPVVPAPGLRVSSGQPLELGMVTLVRGRHLLQITKYYSHLSPRVSLIYDLAYDSGMLQSELFTSRNQNLVLAKLPSSGFWRYGQFFK